MEGLLKSKALFTKDRIVAPELVLYEVTNSVWKHEHLLKDLEDGKPYLSIFYGLINSGKIVIISPSEALMQESYSIAKRNDMTIYDAVFVSMAIKLDLALKTFDKVQIRALASETKNASL